MVGIEPLFREVLHSSARYTLTEADMKRTRGSFLAALLILAFAPAIGRAQPPTAPPPRPAAGEIHNLTWRYLPTPHLVDKTKMAGRIDNGTWSFHDHSKDSAREFADWARDLGAEHLTAIATALKSQRVELEKKEAIVQELLGAKQK